jgi:hypothetical protein
MIAKATNKHTGEIVELPCSTFAELVTAWNIAREYEKVSETLKTQLKQVVPNYIDDKGMSAEHGGYMFRVSTIQRKTYDKAVLRQVFGEAKLDLFLKPDKTKVGSYLKDHLEELGDGSTKLRSAMIDDGRPYQVIKLEKIARDAE